MKWMGCDPTRNPGCLDIVSSQARNLSFQRAQGVDASIQYLRNTANLGKFTITAGGTYVDKLEIRETPSDPLVDVLSEGLLGEFVQTKANASFGWNRGPWGGTLFVNYIGSFTPDDPTIVDGKAVPVRMTVTVNFTRSK